MKMEKHISGRMVTAVALAVFIVAVGIISILTAEAGDSQTWFLSSTTFEVPLAMPYFMYRGANHGKTTAIFFMNTVTSSWIANENATIDISFGTDSWKAVIYYTLATGCSLTVTLCSFNYSNALFTPAVGASETISALDSSPKTLTLTPTVPFTVPKNDALALQISHTGVVGGESYVYVESGKQSTLTSPLSDPGYPVPELSSVILMTSGLVVIGVLGYVGTHKKKQRLDIGGRKT